MSFLQPVVLLGLPLILAPILIHLLNRLRHKPQPWAAMRFLLAATRTSSGRARLRQFLILACRVAAVALLCFFLARPLAGGWMGWAMSAAPDAVVILLDRSASMETASGQSTRRRQALDLLAEAARPYEGGSHLVVIDSASLAATEIARASSLPGLAAAGASDTAADIPAMLRAAFDWLVENHAGTAEIWLASDGQRSNWQPDSPRWKSVMAQLGGLSGRVRVRLLMMDEAVGGADVSLAIREMTRRVAGGRTRLQFTLEARRNRSGAVTLPLTTTLNGQKSTSDLSFDGASLVWRQGVDLGTAATGGWGEFVLPGDANARNNTAYFVYGSDKPLLATIVAGEGRAGRLLRFAAGSRDGKPADSATPEHFADVNLDGRSLLVWQAPLPSGADAARVQSFAASGGAVIFFPPGQPDAGQFDGLGWGAVEDAPSAEGFRIARWEENEGPLAKSDDHASLPLAAADIARRQVIGGASGALAGFDDGTAFLTRKPLGAGEIYFCASLPEPKWSALEEGPVLVPMLQRMMQQGDRRNRPATDSACGELSAADQMLPWVSVDSTTAKDIRTEAGVYRSGERLMAVNRPASEDDPEMLDAGDAAKLFTGLPVQMLQERTRGGRLQGEAWRYFLAAMLLALIAEGFLILPAKSVDEIAPRPVREGLA